MLIRLLTDLDSTKFWNLRLKALKENPESFGASYEEEVNIHIDNRISRFKNGYITPKEENFVLGAFDENNEILGMVGFRREVREKLRHKSNVWGMYVVSGLRQRGIGKLLLTDLINKASKLEELEQINLTVVSSNENAKRLYTSLGFKIYGTEKNALKIGENYFEEDLMVLFLNKKIYRK